jgi:hypothetical protein
MSAAAPNASPAANLSAAASSAVPAVPKASAAAAPSASLAASTTVSSASAASSSSSDPADLATPAAAVVEAHTTASPSQTYHIPNDVSFINVGGDIFAMKQNVPAISLLYQDYATFQKTFSDSRYPPNTVKLLTTYMRWNGWSNDSFTLATIDDKNALKEIFRKRIKQITNEIQEYKKEHYEEKDALFLSHKRKVIARLQGLIDAMDGSKGLTVKPLLKDHDQYLLLLEVAWQLSQPSSKMSSTWKYHLDAIHRLRLQELPQEIENMREQELVQSSNVFKKGIPPTDKSVQGTSALQNRIRSLLTILHIKESLETAPVAAANADNAANAPMAGGGHREHHGQMDHLFRHAMLPLFDHFRVMFDPIYSMLESHHLASTLSSTRLFSSLSSLFYMCHHLHQRSSDRHVDCIYRVHHLPAVVMSFFQEQLRGTRSYVKGLTSSKKREFVQQLSHLPAVRLSSLKTGHATFQFYLLNENMTLPTAEQWVDPTYSNRTAAIYESLSEFFTDRHLYMVCGGAQHVPLRIRDVDGRSLRKDDVRVDPLYSHRLNRTPLFLDEVFTFDPHVLYLDTELVLSMLLVSKDHLSS